MSTTKLDVIQRIVHDHQAEKVTYTTPTGKQQKLRIDALTASAILTIHNALTPPQRVHFLSYSWPRLVTLTWKCITKYGRT